MKIAVVNESTTVMPAEAKVIAAALEQQGGPLALAWERKRPVVRYYASEALAPPDYDVLAMFDAPDQAGALGYHDVTPSGRPYGKVFTTYGGQAWPALVGNPSVMSIMSHEFCEIVGDPPASFWAVYDAAGNMIALELCDPVQNDSYQSTVGAAAHPVTLSNFVLPAYFNPLNTTGPFDYLHKLSGAAPSMTPGGYAIVARATGEKQVLGEAPAWKHGLGGRSEVRAS